MIAAGVNAKGSSDLHGYASITITLDRYGRLMSGFGGGGPLVYSTPISRPNRNGQPLECAGLHVQSMAFRFWTDGPDREVGAACRTSRSS